MSSHCNIENAYSNEDMDKLERMARKKISKNNFVNKAYRDYNKYISNTKKQMKNLKKVHGFNFFADEHFEGDNENQEGKNTGTLMTDIYKKRKQMRDNESFAIDSFSDGDVSIGSISIDDMSNMSDIDSEYTVDSGSFDRLLSKNKQNDFDDCISTDSISIDSLSSNEGLMRHAAKCGKCKRKILRLIKNSKKKKRKNRKKRGKELGKHIKFDEESTDFSELDTHSYDSKSLGSENNHIMSDEDHENYEISIMKKKKKPDLKLEQSGKSNKSKKLNNTTKEFIVMFFVSVLIIFILDMILRAF